MAEINAGGTKEMTTPTNLNECKKLRCKCCSYDIGVNTDLCEKRITFAYDEINN